jgi:hypothetical protein
MFTWAGSGEGGERMGIPLHFITAVLMLTFLQGAYGSLIGWHPSHYVVWPPLIVITIYSLLAMFRQESIVVHIPEFNSVIVALYLMFMWRSVVYFWSPLDVMTLKEIIKTLYLLIFVLTSYYVVTRSNRKNLLRMVVYVVTFALMASVVSYIYNIMNAGGFARYGDRSFKGSLDLFYAANSAGGVVLLLALWNWVIVFIGGRYLRIGLFNVFVSLFLLIGIASYAALGGYVVSMSVVFIYYVYRTRRSMLLFYFSILFAVFIMVISVYFVIMSTTEGSFSTLYARFRIWAGALEVLGEGSWLTGSGGGAAFLITRDAGLRMTTLHSVFMYSLALGGVMELMIVLFIYFRLIVISMRQSHGRGMLLLTFISGIFVRNLVESSGLLFGYLNTTWVYLSWYVLITIIVLMKDDEDIKDYVHSEAGEVTV